MQTNSPSTADRTAAAVEQIFERVSARIEEHGVPKAPPMQTYLERDPESLARHVFFAPDDATACARGRTYGEAGVWRLEPVQGQPGRCVQHAVNAVAKSRAGDGETIDMPGAL